MSKGMFTLEIDNKNALAQLSKLERDLREKVIKKAIDPIILESVDRLKSQLLFFLQSPKAAREHLDYLRQETEAAIKENKQRVVNKFESQKATTPSGSSTAIEINRDLTKASGFNVSTGPLRPEDNLQNIPIKDRVVVEGWNRVGEKEADKARPGYIHPKGALIVIQQAGPGQKNVAGQIEMPLRSGDSAESVLARSDEVFQKAAFLIYDSGGRPTWWFPKANVKRISNFKKVQCSPSRDMAAQDKRVDQVIASGKGTIKIQIKMKDSGFFEYVRTSGDYVNGTELVHQFQNAAPASTIMDTLEKATGKVMSDSDYPSQEEAAAVVADRAKGIGDLLTADPALKELAENLRYLDEQSKKIPSLDTYLKLMRFVRGLRANKKASKQTVSYSLVSTESLSFKEFTEDLQRTYFYWKVREQQLWVEQVQKAIQRTIAEVSKTSSK